MHALVRRLGEGVSDIAGSDISRARRVIPIVVIDHDACRQVFDLQVIIRTA
jgi:hypothetical protein